MSDANKLLMKRFIDDYQTGDDQQVLLDSVSPRLVNHTPMSADAFGRGDIPATLDRLAPDVAFDADWRDHFAQRAGVPLLVPRRGRAEVAEFFAVVADCTMEHFAVHDIIGTGRQVVAEITSGIALRGGGRFLDEELHLWTFGAHGLVTRFRHYVDTAKHIAAASGEDTTA